MAGKRAHGEGTVYRRRDGRWCAEVMLGYGPDGRRQRLRVYGQTRREALQRLAQARARAQGLAAPGLTVAAYLHAWLEAVRPSLAPSTVLSYERLLRLHVLPVLGKVRLADLSPARIQEAWRVLQREGRSPVVIAQAHKVLRAALRQAVVWGLLAQAPTAGVRLPRPAPADRVLWSVEETRAALHRLAQEAPEWWPRVVLAIATGLRRGELLGLQWADIDWEQQTVSVRRQVRDLPRRHGGPQVAEPKTRATRRTIALPDLALVALRLQRAQQERAGSPSPWVFPAPEGGPLLPNRLSTAWRSVVRRLGLRPLRWHDLRHLSASLLVRARLSPKEIQARLGHASMGTTMDLYAHLLDQADRAAARALDQALGFPSDSRHGGGESAAAQD